MTDAAIAETLPRRPLWLPRLHLRTPRLPVGRSRARATPTILQMEAVECGAASLAMVLAYHGRWVALEELRLACGVSRDGSKASNLLKAARRYGLAAKGFKKEPEELDGLPQPSIIHWNFNHFVVFEGFRGEWAFINDPAIGRRRVSRDELGEAFTGVVLAFEPSDEFRRAGHAPRAIPALWRQLAGARAGLALVVLLSLTLVLPGIMVPAFARVFIDDIVVGGSWGWLGPLLLGLALTAVLRAAILVVRQHHLLRLQTRLGVTMTSRFFWHVLHLPISFFTQRHAGDVASRITINEDVAKLLSGELAGTMLGLATIAFYGVAMAAYDGVLAAIAVPLVLLNLVALRIVSRSREASAGRLAHGRGQLAGATVGTIRSIETVKSSGLELDAFARWAGYHAKAMVAAQELDRQTAYLSAVPPLLTALSNAAVLGVGAYRVMHGVMSIGELVAFQTLMASFAQPLGRLVALGANLQQVKADLARIGDVLAYPSPLRAQQRPGDGTGASSAPARLQGGVELRNVSFGYNPNEAPLIEDFNLSVRPGQRVALIGASGSGKSTIARLICGLYPIWTGEIRLDGRPLEQIAPEVLANSLAYVDQDGFLFAATVRENITLWDHSIDERRLARALQDAVIFEDIALRPGVYDYPITEGGLDFSGGQRQRLEIARALVGDPSIVVLDEATSGLDPLIEEKIDENLRRRGCTAIIIAHRLSTIRDCDEIIMLVNGRIAGRGGHAELIESCPPYRDLLRGE
jgi:NHLM bacteriocin system ABC transporter peptidase/ATP-binding protein